MGLFKRKPKPAYYSMTTAMSKKEFFAFLHLIGAGADPSDAERFVNHYGAETATMCADLAQPTGDVNAAMQEAGKRES